MKKYTIVIGFVLIFLSCKGGPEYFNDLAQRESGDFKKIAAKLNINKGDYIADLGAGGGYFSFKLSPYAGKKGRVYSVDVSKDSYRYISDEIKRRKLENVFPVLATFTDSRLKKNSVDAVFIRNAYHDIQNRVAYFKKLKSVLKKNGRVVIIDYDPSKLGFFRKMFGHALEERIIKDEMKQAGYKLLKNYSFLKRQSFNIFVAQ